MNDSTRDCERHRVVPVGEREQPVGERGPSGANRTRRVSQVTGRALVTLNSVSSLKAPSTATLSNEAWR